MDRRHCIERLQYEIAARKLGLSIPIALFHAGYSKELELEADRVGIAYSVAGGYSPQGGIAMFRRFQEKFERAQRRSSTPSEEVAGVLISGLGEYLRSHPSASDRIAEIEKEIIAHGWKRTPLRKLRMPSRN